MKIKNQKKIKNQNFEIFNYYQFSNFYKCELFPKMEIEYDKKFILEELRTKYKLDQEHNLVVVEYEKNDGNNNNNNSCERCLLTWNFIQNCSTIYNFVYEFIDSVTVEKNHPYTRYVFPEIQMISCDRLQALCEFDKLYNLYENCSGAQISETNNPFAATYDENKKNGFLKSTYSKDILSFFGKEKNQLYQLLRDANILDYHQFMQCFKLYVKQQIIQSQTLDELCLQLSCSPISPETQKERQSNFSAMSPLINKFCSQNFGIDQKIL